MQVKEIHLLLNAGIVLLLCAAAAGARAITFSPPEVVVSPPPPITPGPEVGETFETPGVRALSRCFWLPLCIPGAIRAVDALACSH